MTNNSPLILAIETALDGCGIGLLYEGNVIAFYESMMRSQSEVLIPRIQELVKDKGFELTDLNAVSVTLGPGSFTGSRVGLTAAQGISYAASIPCFGYSTLEIVTRCEEGQVAVALDSKRGDAFFQIFDAEENPVNEATILSYEDVIEQTKDMALLTNIIDLNGLPFEGQKVVEELLLKTLGDYSADKKQNKPLAPIYLRDAEVSKSKIKYREIG